ncbi:hypothetical protein [Neorhizobium vignae]|uniref:hypothetical protein n=1 Tax=Neorhizobium vignae TaxID=690585 RepID=UPI00055F41CE|nr:hypothetical protein [Neorhizobium vignae]
MPTFVDHHRDYRIAIYSPNDRYAVITSPGSNAVLKLGEQVPRATVVEGLGICLERARQLIDGLVQGSTE